MIRLPLLLLASLFIFLAANSLDAASGDPPRVGDEAPPLKLRQLDGSLVELEQVNQEGPVAVIVLRGYPGYQCPLCQRQVSDLMRRKDELSQIFAKVILVYPGPALNLIERAKEFTRGSTYPEPFVLVTDPDYQFTNAWNLRWDQLRETAYPSTFIVGKDGKIRFARVSKSHGGRVSAIELLHAARR